MTQTDSVFETIRRLPLTQSSRPATSGVKRHKWGYPVCRWLLIILFGLTNACGDSTGYGTVGPSGTELTFSPPSFLSTRAINPEALELSVSVNGAQINMQSNADAEWRGTINLACCRQYNIRVIWSERLQDGTNLVLGEALDVVSIVNQNPVTVEFVESEFDTWFDSDNDGFSNLTEQINDTNPLIAATETRSKVLLSLSLLVPQQFLEAGLNEDVLDVSASINGLGVLLVRQEGAWQGQANVSVDERAFVTVVWRHTGFNGLRLAQSASGRLIGSNVTLTPDAGDFRTDYDVDSDGVSNLQEVLNGTNPRSNSEF